MTSLARSGNVTDLRDTNLLEGTFGLVLVDLQSTKVS